MAFVDAFFSCDFNIFQSLIKPPDHKALIRVISVHFECLVNSNTI